MKRIVGAVSSALRYLGPKPKVPAVVHQERVRKAMEALGPKGRRLPSESTALAMEVAAADGKTEEAISLKSPDEIFLAANALHTVRPVVLAVREGLHQVGWN